MTTAPSITYWNRLEPSPRSSDFVRSLAARVHDPLWVLTRQWQLGELRGVDSGSPAWIEVATTTDRLSDWSVGNALHPLDRPAEALLGERQSLDLATGVELGQWLESKLPAALAPWRGVLRAVYPIAPPSAADETTGDEELIRFRRLMAGRALDGAALYRAALHSPSDAVDLPGIDAPSKSTLAALVQELVAVANELLDVDTPVDPPAWNAEHLEHEIDLVARAPGLRATSRPRGAAEVTWDTLSTGKTLFGVPPTQPAVQDVVTYLPALVRYRGMPSPRWWDFDSASLDFGAVDVERREVAKLVVLDMLAQQRGDWYVIPIEQPVGSTMHIDRVAVRDVFGILTLVPPAADAGIRWPIFSIGGALGSADHVLVPTVAPFIQYGDAVEEVRFTRDDMLGVVWAAEETIEGALGQPLRGAVRAAMRAAGAPEPESGFTPFGYRLNAGVPEQWAAFVPVTRGGQVRLERAAGAPAGRILGRPDPYRIAEEELRRNGVRVARVPARCRDTQGRTRVWIAWKRDVSAVRDAPLPRFDALVAQEVSDQPFVAVEAPAAMSFVQGPFGGQGNFELVAAAGVGGMAHYWRNNDDPALPWFGPASFAAAHGLVEGVSIIFSSFGNLEVVARIGQRLAHYWRDASLQWHGPDFFADGVAGTASFIQGTVGSPGNFEVVTPLAGGGLAHYWRNNQTFAWSQPTTFAGSAGPIADASLIGGPFGGNLEVVVRIGGQLAHLWRNQSTLVWSEPSVFASGVSGTPSLIRSLSGNFEVVAPAAGGGMIHVWRNNSDPQLPWSSPEPFGSGEVRAVSLIQTNFDDHLELVARAGSALVHYWRESGLPLAWHGPVAVTT